MAPWLRSAGLAGVAILLPNMAFAHTGVGDTHGFALGVLHPLLGVDHVLAMIASGLFAAHLGGRALWLVPLAFMGVMAGGGLLGMNGFEIPFGEAGIALSVIVLGLGVTMQISVPTAAAMALVGVFAVFHGHAHGLEMPADAGGLGYAAGFVLATGLLHAVGITFGTVIGRLGQRFGTRVAQATGGAMAWTGAGLLVGWI